MEKKSIDTFLDTLNNDVERRVAMGRIKIKQIEKRNNVEHQKTMAGIVRQLGEQEYVEFDTEDNLTIDEMRAIIVTSNDLKNPKLSNKDLLDYQKVASFDEERQMGMVVNIIANGQDVDKLSK